MASKSFWLLRLKWTSLTKGLEVREGSSKETSSSKICSWKNGFLLKEAGLSHLLMKLPWESDPHSFEEASETKLDWTVMMLVVVLARGLMTTSSVWGKSKTSRARLKLIFEDLFMGEGQKMGDGKERHSDWERFMTSSGVCCMVVKVWRGVWISFFE